MLQEKLMMNDLGAHFPLTQYRLLICAFPYLPTMSYNRKWNVLSASLNKTFPSFLPYLHFFQVDSYTQFDINGVHLQKQNMCYPRK